MHARKLVATTGLQKFALVTMRNEKPRGTKSLLVALVVLTWVWRADVSAPDG